MKTFTDQQKAEAVDLYLHHGTKHAADHIGASPRSVIRWAKAAGVVSQDRREKTAEARATLMAEYEERRARHRLLMAEAFEDALERRNHRHKDFRGKDALTVWWDTAPSGDFKNYITAAAILLDKMRLEEGKATERTEQMTVTEVEAWLAAQFSKLDENA